MAFRPYFCTQSRAFRLSFCTPLGSSGSSQTYTYRNRTSDRNSFWVWNLLQLLVFTCLDDGLPSFSSRSFGIGKAEKSPLHLGLVCTSLHAFDYFVSNNCFWRGAYPIYFARRPKLTDLNLFSISFYKSARVSKGMSGNLSMLPFLWCHTKAHLIRVDFEADWAAVHYWLSWSDGRSKGY